ncbi:hypothetical protein H6771_00060 [Candidatus Peribacteria bacterium]|nr:hypothetical protein [Candidatus Peribacteria bacterium]
MQRHAPGYVLYVVLILGGLLMLLGTGMVRLLGTELQFAPLFSASEQAYFAAEGAAEMGLYALERDDTQQVLELPLPLSEQTAATLSILGTADAALWESYTIPPEVVPLHEFRACVRLPMSIDTDDSSLQISPKLITSTAAELIFAPFMGASGALADWRVTCPYTLPSGMTETVSIAGRQAINAADATGVGTRVSTLQGVYESFDPLAEQDGALAPLQDFFADEAFIHTAEATQCLLTVQNTFLNGGFVPLLDLGLRGEIPPYRVPIIARATVAGQEKVLTLRYPRRQESLCSLDATTNQ